ncbi:MAG: hypothetical protein JXB06_01465 [Spirochaetales bacterium]|nr:hypothetical protein [Spirochaetales bacterium]
MGKSDRVRQPDPFEEEQPPGYHYSRQDRLSLPTAPRFPQKGGGIFRRNRTLLILLLDLVIVMILGVIVMRFFYAQVNRADLDGYSIVLRGVRSQEVVIATLTVANSSSQSQLGVLVRFSLVRNPGEEDSTYLSGMAPADRGGQLILRAALPAEDSPEVLYAEVRIGDTRKRLSTGL